MFSHQIHDLMARFDKVHEPGKGIMENNEQQAELLWPHCWQGVWATPGSILQGKRARKNLFVIICIFSLFHDTLKIP